MSIPPTSHENTLGPYRLLRKLGQGGMGVVYLGHDPHLNRQVAIKVLRADVGAGSAKQAASVAKRFMREAQSSAKLNHPHVVTIYTVGQQGAVAGDAGPPFIVMEYVPGGSLAERVRKDGPLHWREALLAGRDALRGLAAAHRAGIVHRDVKPANLMRGRGVGGEEIIKLADFGLARVNQVRGSSDEGELTFPGAFVGSPSYSSPEQIAGAARVDGRADLYSLAATIYALVAGQPPFIADDPADVMEAHLREAFPEVRQWAPTAPAALQEFLTRASEKKAAKRFAGAVEMLAALEGLLALPADVAPAPVKRWRAAASRIVPRAEETVVELESKLALARKSSDSSTQLSTLRSLYGLYAQLDRREDAVRTFREALVVHVKMQAPAMHGH